MINKKNKGLLIALIALVLVLVGIYFYTSQTSIAEGDFLTYRMYDKEGNIIPKSLLKQSVLEGVPGVYFIDITVTLTNTGNKALTCDLVTLTPTAFNSALTKTTKTLPVAGKTAWTSSLIDITQFEGQTQPTAFTAKARCYYNDGGSTQYLPDKTGSLNLNIQPDSEGGFSIELETGGDPTEYCGDGVCQADESSSSCPDDCAVANNVKFRTSDLSYPSGSAVAYTSSCGSTLTAYGYVTSSQASGTCASNLNHPYCGGTCVSLQAGLPGGYKSGGATPALWRHATDTTVVFVCDDDGSAYQLKKYDSDDSDKSKVDTTATSFDAAKEIAC